MAFTNKYNLQDSLSRSHKIHLSLIRILDTMFCALRERNMNSKENCFRERKKPCLTSVNFIEFRFFPVIAKSVRDVFNINKTPKVVSVGCVGLWKHNSVLSEFKNIRETTGKM